MVWNEDDTCTAGSAASGAVLLQRNNASHICNLECPSRGWDMLVTEHLLALQKHPPCMGHTAVHNSILKDFVPSSLCRHRHIHSEEQKHSYLERKNTQLKPIVAVFSLTISKVFQYTTDCKALRCRMCLLTLWDRMGVLLLGLVIPQALLVHMRPAAVLRAAPAYSTSHRPCCKRK